MEEVTLLKMCLKVSASLVWFLLYTALLFPLASSAVTHGFGYGMSGLRKESLPFCMDSKVLGTLVAIAAMIHTTLGMVCPLCGHSSNDSGIQGVLSRVDISSCAP